MGTNISDRAQGPQTPPKFDIAQIMTEGPSQAENLLDVLGAPDRDAARYGFTVPRHVQLYTTLCGEV